MLSTRYSLLFLCCILISFSLVGCIGTPSPAPLPSPTIPIPSTLVSEDPPGLEKFFQGYSGAFVLYDLKNDRYTCYEPEQSAERLLPASTFKILNALIGLETGVIPDENYVIPWDGTQYSIPSWNQDHTLKTAIQNSVVWYYQELARRVGQEKMQHYIDLVHYGNQDISGEIDNFWLEGNLRISANEQVEFLKQLYQEDLPFSQRSIRIVKDILVLQDTPTYRMSGKTGSGIGTTNVGWFVGYVEEQDQVIFFATNIKGSSSEVNGPKAKEITQDVLNELGFLGQ